MIIYMSQTCKYGDLKYGDLALDLQSELALKLKYFVWFLVNVTSFEPCNFSF